MHRFIIGAFVLGAMFSTSAEAAIRFQPINYCPAKASYSFKIVGARGEIDGVGSEYQWLRNTLPGWKRNAQALINDKRGRPFDLLYLSKGSKHAIACFDISGFFGRMG